MAADAVFGKRNFATTVVWEHRTTRENRRAFSNNHEYLLVYAKCLRTFAANRNRLEPSAAVLRRYANPDNDPRGPWQSVSANVQAGHAVASQFYEITAPNGRVHSPPKGRCWVYTKHKMYQAIADNEVWFGHNGDGVPRLKRFLTDGRCGLTPPTLWPASEVGTTLRAKKHLLSLLRKEEVFDTPKPEELIQRIFEIATDPGDLILDPYLGSGTSAAVALKTGRRFIGVEVGSHAVSHCVQRLRKVVEGEGGGISDSVGWKGGGGGRFYRIAGASRA